MIAQELPADILLEIYTHLKWDPQGQGDSSDAGKPLIVFSGVCQYWRHVFTGLPSLWASVIFTPQDTYNPLAYLEKSLDLPFDLLYNTHQDRRWSKDENQSYQVTLQQVAIVQHIRRLRTLFLKINNIIELRALLANLGRQTANKLTTIRIDTSAHSQKILMPDFSPLFPSSPNLKYISSTAKFSFAFPNTLSSLTTLHLQDFAFSVAEYRQLFRNLPNLTTLFLIHIRHTEFDLDYAASIHNFDVENLVAIPSLQYLSVIFPGHVLGQCSCLLPILHLPNVKILDVSNQNYFFQFEDLGHFHPHTVEAWNEPTSPLQKARLRHSWGWTPNIFPQRSDPFTKLVDIELVDNLMIQHLNLKNFIPFKSLVICYTPFGWREMNLMEIIPADMRNEKLKIQIPLASIGVNNMEDEVTVRTNVEQGIEVTYSNKRRSIWRDIEAEGGECIPAVVKDRTKRNPDTTYI